MALATRSLVGNPNSSVGGGQRNVHHGHGQGSASNAVPGPVEGAGSFSGVSVGGDGAGPGFQFSGEMNQGFRQDQGQQFQQSPQRDPFSLFSTPSAVFAALFGLEHTVSSTDGSPPSKTPLASIVRGAVSSYEKTAMVISGMQSPLGGSLSMRL